MLAAGAAQGAALDARTAAGLEKLLPTPRLYVAKITGVAPQMSVVRYCMSAESLEQRLSALPEPPKGAPAPDGCTHKTVKKLGGYFRRETVCRRKDGARSDWRQVTEGTADHMTMHSERGAGDGGTYRTDWDLTQAGPCPPTLKPGQMMMANGAVVDTGALPARLQALRAEAARR